MPHSAKDIFDMPDRNRRRFRFRIRVHRRYRKERREKRTVDELLAWLRDNKVTSTRQMEKVRKKGDPNVYDVRKAFGGSWSDAMGVAHGPREENFTGSPEYLAKVVVQLGLWKYNDYIEARRKRPDIVPSMRQVRRRYTTFKNMVSFARRLSLSAVFKDYIVLRRRLGRVPSVTESAENGVCLGKAIEFCGSKRRLDSFVDTMEGKSHEKP